MKKKRLSGRFFCVRSTCLRQKYLGGEIILDVSGDSRKDLQVEDLIAMFRKMRGETLDDDALLIG